MSLYKYKITVYVNTSDLWAMKRSLGDFFTMITNKNKGRIKILMSQPKKVWLHNITLKSMVKSAIYKLRGFLTNKRKWLLDLYPPNNS